MIAVQNNHNSEEDEGMIDWTLPLSFVKKRHTEVIEGGSEITQTWRMKERVSIFKRIDSTDRIILISKVDRKD